MSKRNRDDVGSPTNPSKKLNPGPKDNILSISASFKFHDLKGDGVIDREELLSYFKSDKTVSAIIERLDKNRDGVISYAGEYPSSFHFTKKQTSFQPFNNLRSS
jgi:hypothetical protein